MLQLLILFRIFTHIKPPVDNNVLIRSGEAQLVGWSRLMLYLGFNNLPRSVFWSADFNGRSDNTDVIRLRIDTMPSVSKSIRYTLRHLLITVFICSFLITISSCFSRVAISTKTLDRLYDLEETLTRDDVLRIAGPPQGRDGNEEFYYNVWNGPVFFSDSFLIVFDEAGKVTWMSF